MENYYKTSGHDLNVFKEMFRLNIGKQICIYLSTDVWNSLAKSLDDAPPLQIFEEAFIRYGK